MHLLFKSMIFLISSDVKSFKMRHFDYSYPVVEKHGFLGTIEDVVIGAVYFSMLIMSMLKIIGITKGG